MSFKNKNRLKLEQRIVISHTKVMGERLEYSLTDSVNVHIKDLVGEHVDIDYVVKKINSVLPNFFLKEIDAIYVGEFQHLLDREVNAAYDNGAIYVSNIQDNEDDMIDDIIHEMAHAIEEKYGMDLYADGKIEIEFLGKRKRLFQIMRNEFDEEIINVANYFTDIEYSKDFDDFLYKVVGYPSLTSLTMGLFISPYAVTSLGEYYATGFEEYFLKDKKYLRNISPALYEKIYILENKE